MEFAARIKVTLEAVFSADIPELVPEKYHSDENVVQAGNEAEVLSARRAAAIDFEQTIRDELAQLGGHEVIEVVVEEVVER